MAAPELDFLHRTTSYQNAYNFSGGCLVAAGVFLAFLGLVVGSPELALILAGIALTGAVVLFAMGTLAADLDRAFRVRPITSASPDIASQRGGANDAKPPAADKP
jgi:Zn-dependent membrane protease YugP